MRQTNLAKLATDLVASTLAKDRPSGGTNVGEQIKQIETDSADWMDARVALLRQAKREAENAKRVAEKFVERQRRPRGRRRITNSFLKSVAEVYRENIHGAPTKAVAEHFGVENRMASTYVDRARRAGYLPPTKQGQKKA